MQRRTQSKRNGCGSDDQRKHGGNGCERVRPYGGAHCECFWQAGQVGWKPGKISHLASILRERLKAIGVWHFLVLNCIFGEYVVKKETIDFLQEGGWVSAPN